MRGENTTVLIIGDTTETKGFMQAMLVVTISAGSSALLFFLSFLHSLDVIQPLSHIAKK